MMRADGGRQLSVAVNLQRWNRLAPDGCLQQHSLDAAMSTLHRVVTGG